MKLKRMNDVDLNEDDDVISKSHSDDFMNDEMNDDEFSEDLGFDDGSMGGPTPMEKHSDLLKSLTDFEPFMKIMVAEWLGMVWSEGDEDWVEDPNVEPTMNLHGARWCVNFMRVYTRDNNIITNLDKDNYVMIMSDVVETAWLNIGCRSEEFAIKSDGDILKVCNQLEHAAALVLIGTGGTSNYKDLLTKSVSRSENVQYHEGNYGRMPMPEKKMGFFQSVGNMFKGN